ncbi:MAG: hypothetical protein AAB367_02545 [Patescibacteria group bacterium]
MASTAEIARDVEYDANLKRARRKTETQQKPIINPQRLVKLQKLVRLAKNPVTSSILITIALTKDLGADIGLNFLGIGLIPILGQLFGWALSIIEYFIMQHYGFFEDNGKRSLKRWRYILSFLVDGLPIDELPISTIATLIGIRNIRKAAKDAEKELGGQ